MSFEDVAKGVLKKSIRSAVCIDDMFEQPYMIAEEVEARNKELSERDGGEVHLDSKVPRALYSSFRESGICDLDIYNFKSFEESWHPEYMLNNKDLLVIDWELEGKNNYESTIKILREAIQTNKYPNVPFIIIYTYEPKEHFQSIMEQIVSNFHPYNKEGISVSKLYSILKSDFNGYFEEEFLEDEFIDWFNQQRKSFFEFWSTPNSKAREIITGEIYSSFNFEFSVKEKKKHKTGNKFEKNLRKLFSLDDNEKCIEQLYYLSIVINSDGIFKFDRINTSDIGVKINNTVLTLFSKEKSPGKGVKPEDVFDSFSNLVCNDPHNFLSLLSLEMKDRLRDDLTLISDKISSLDERAFFHHMNSYKSRSENFKNEFFDFLLRGWVDEIETYNFNNLPDVFSVVDEYAQNHNYEKLDGNNFKNEIGELGLKLSTVEIDDRLERTPTLRFGDILIDREANEYYLCITPACVCVDACKKVDNNFYFIKSNDVKEFERSSAAKKIEIDYYSIVKDNSTLFAIKWECKPFTLYIEQNNLKNLKTHYSSRSIELEYVTTTKENFAQRIANQSFTYGTSIGIDLPHI
ncbi:MAG: response regulator receiver domain [Candidatus Paceibacterota bacterium]